MPAIPRRETFSRLKKAILAGVGLSTASKFEQKAAQAADETLLEPGKIVTMQVDNLEGEPGNTGVIKIQLQPSWAPRGVERFEVGFVGRTIAFGLLWSKFDSNDRLGWKNYELLFSLISHHFPNPF